jgi:hypothetical protein
LAIASPFAVGDDRKSGSSRIRPCLRSNRQLVEKFPNLSWNKHRHARFPLHFKGGQARDRLTAAGYTSVHALAKDDKGIWRGNATKDGKSVSVGLDYKGNITAQ